MIHLAASRYGLTDPSPDDILGAAWPRYNEDAIHTAGYHRDFDAVMRRVARALPAPVPCRICGAQLQDLRGNRRYCSPKCAKAAVLARVGRYDPRPVEGALGAQIVAMYRAKASVAEIAKLCHAGKGRVSATLRAAGLLRSRGKPEGQQLSRVA